MLKADVLKKEFASLSNHSTTTISVGRLVHQLNIYDEDTLLQKNEVRRSPSISNESVAWRLEAWLVSSRYICITPGASQRNNTATISNRFLAYDSRGWWSCSKTVCRRKFWLRGFANGEVSWPRIMILTMKALAPLCRMSSAGALTPEGIHPAFPASSLHNTNLHYAKHLALTLSE